jgi:diguanylate cyclase (GGDEF)-like protein
MDLIASVGKQRYREPAGVVGGVVEIVGGPGDVVPECRDVLNGLVEGGAFRKVGVVHSHVGADGHVLVAEADSNADRGGRSGMQVARPYWIGMRRRFRYALTAGFLSSGAPAGLLGIRLAKRHEDDAVSLRQVRTEIAADRAAYVYVGGATALIFALFGYILGRQADQLAELSETDPLTGLLNARGFSSRFSIEIQRTKRYRQPLSLLFLDLDGLKSINDRYGHRSGSEALRQMAAVIRSELRETDAASRWGGDEFTILAPQTGAAAAMALAERIRCRIAEDGQAWPLTASVGIATHDAGDYSVPADAALLMRAADMAMYDAKKRGKNSVIASEVDPTEDVAPA